MSEIAFPVPDRGILARRDTIVAGLRRIMPSGGVIDAADERRVFETDALTAYRRLPLAVVLPGSTEAVAAVMAYLSGQALDAGGYDLLALVCGAEGQLGIVTEATVRILRSAEGARPVLFGFASSEAAAAAVAAIIGAGIIPVAMEFMDAPAIRI